MARKIVKNILQHQKHHFNQSFNEALLEKRPYIYYHLILS